MNDRSHKVLPMPVTTLQLEDRLTHLTLAPGIGGSIVNWTVKASGQPLLRHSDQAALLAGTPRRLGCYPLAPWSNRIAKGGFDTPHGWLALEANADNSPLPIHGSAWQQAWQVVEHSAHEALLRLDSQVPFAYQAEQRVHLHDGRLHIQLRVTHKAESANWHGLGLHPYFPRTPHTRLQAHAEAVWHCDDDRLPTHLSELPEHWDLRQTRALPDVATDNAFSGWDGRASIVQADAGYRLDIEASGCDFYLLFCPKDMAFFCFEPVSHPVNAHHLPGRPGLELLHKDQSLQLDFSLRYSALT